MSLRLFTCALGLSLFLLTSLLQASQMVVLKTEVDSQALLQELAKHLPKERLSRTEQTTPFQSAPELAERYLNSKDAKVILVAWLGPGLNEDFTRLFWTGAEGGSHSLELEHSTKSAELMSERLFLAYLDSLDALADASSPTTPAPCLPNNPKPEVAKPPIQRPQPSAWSTQLLGGLGINYDKVLTTHFLPRVGFGVAHRRGKLNTRFGMGARIGTKSRVTIEEIEFTSSERGVFAFLGLGGIFGKTEWGAQVEFRGSEFSVRARGPSSSGSQAAPLFAPYTGAFLGYRLGSTLWIRALLGAEYLLSRPQLLKGGDEIARPAGWRPELGLHLVYVLGI